VVVAIADYGCSSCEKGLDLFARFVSGCLGVLGEGIYTASQRFALKRRWMTWSSISTSLLR
jgi:hypothetical protein